MDQMQMQSLLTQIHEGEGYESHDYQPDPDWDDPDEFYVTHDEQGYLRGIPCIVCGTESRRNCVVDIGPGNVLFGACSTEHAQAHAKDILERFAAFRSK